MSCSTKHMVPPKAQCEECKRCNDTCPAHLVEGSVYFQKLYKFYSDKGIQRSFLEYLRDVADVPRTFDENQIPRSENHADSTVAREVRLTV